LSRPARHSRTAALIDLFACFLIPAYTLLFAGSVKWFGTNFSVLAVTGPDHYRGFFCWGLLAGGYFFALLLDLAHTLPTRRGRFALRTLTLTAIFCLTAALAIPYLPALAPRWAKLHVVLAFFACVILMLAFFLILLRCRRENATACRGLFSAWWAIAVVSAALFSLCGMVSSALEVFFTISASLLARKIWYLRQRQI